MRPTKEEEFGREGKEEQQTNKEEEGKEEDDLEEKKKNRRIAVIVSVAYCLRKVSINKVYYTHLTLPNNKDRRTKD